MSISKKIDLVINNKVVFAVLSVLMRIMISAIFILSGFGKVFNYTETYSYMSSMGVPGFLLPLVILTELGGGAAFLLGYKVRFTSFVLLGFCVVSALIFHTGADQQSQIMFMKNISMAGGLLSTFIFGGGGFSLEKK
ncbi:TPA: DoxX family protein [Serratia marcescens]|nr:DoxX family protein [Serratia marcescens]